jgi:4-amino-4-deoxychorismate lyase
VADRVLGILGAAPDAPRLAAPDSPVLRADDLGLGRGDGCFETCRVRRSASTAGLLQVERLDEHLERLVSSARALELPAPDLARWREVISLVVGAWDSPVPDGLDAVEAGLKLMLTRGVDGTDIPTGLALLSPIGPSALAQRVTGVRVITLSTGRSTLAYRDAPWLLGGVKSLSYAVNMAALREAHRRGADDVILLSSQGDILEAPTATIVWMADDALLTTPLEGTGILAGTTQLALFEAARANGITCAIAPATLSDLRGAQGAWLASSLRGVAAITAIDGEPLPCDTARTARMQQFAGF